MQTKRFTYAISTMGCKANLADSQKLESQLQAIGGKPALDGESSDLFVLNTCTVTDQADREAKVQLRKAKAKVQIATGCLAEVSPNELSASNSGIKVIRNSAKQEFEEIVSSLLDSGLVSNSEVFHGQRIKWHSSILENRSAKEANFYSAENRTRSFYKFQDGCNAFCTYCIIPHARGRSRSLPVNQIIHEVQSLVDSGVREVVLTAIHAADYESDGLDFTHLVEKILEKTSVPRLRLTSLDPLEISDKLIQLMQLNPRLCSHFHVSLQSANTNVLQKMKRNYNSNQVEDCFYKIAEKLPHAYVGLDIIVGFPSETEEQFEDTYSRLEKLPWTKAHVFPFSLRKNTQAARMVQEGFSVPTIIKTKRAKKIRELSEKKLNQCLQQKIGSVQEVLIEKKRIQVLGRSCSFGHTRSYHKVVVPGLHEENKLARVKVIGFEKDFLKGDLI